MTVNRARHSSATDEHIGHRAKPSPFPTSAKATTVMRGNRRVDTRPEMHLRSALHSRGIRFRKDLPIRLSKMVVRPDIVFTRRRVVVFVDGCFWHACPTHYVASKSNRHYWLPKIERNRERDVRQTAALAAAGWEVLRIWEHVPIDEAVNLVVAALASRAATPDVRAETRQRPVRGGI